MPRPRRHAAVVEDPLAGDELWAHVEPAAARRLLVSAVAAFSRRGFHAATTREIGEGAGMSPAAMYIHYRSKADMLAEISRVGHEAALGCARDALGAVPPDDHAGRLAALVAAAARWHAEHHVLARVVQYELGSLPPDLLAPTAAPRHAYADLFRDVLRAGRDAGAFTVDDVDGTARAAISLCVDVARWYAPSGRLSPEAIGELYAGLVVRMAS